MRILHVEDHLDTRELVEFTVRAQGWEYVGVSNAKDGLRLARQQSFDLFLIDNWIEGGSGNGLAIGLRTVAPGIPILFYSAAVYQFDIKTALACGATGYLEKPSGPDALIAEILRLTHSEEKN